MASVSKGIPCLKRNLLNPCYGSLYKYLTNLSNLCFQDSFIQQVQDPQCRRHPLYLFRHQRIQQKLSSSLILFKVNPSHQRNSIRHPL
jgi:hypothetical protein